MFNLLSLACKLHNNLLSLTNFSFKKRCEIKYSARPIQKWQMKLKVTANASIILEFNHNGNLLKPWFIRNKNISLHSFLWSVSCLLTLSFNSISMAICYVTFLLTFKSKLTCSLWDGGWTSWFSGGTYNIAFNLYHSLLKFKIQTKLTILIKCEFNCSFFDQGESWS